MMTERLRETKAPHSTVPCCLFCWLKQPQWERTKGHANFWHFPGALILVAEPIKLLGAYTINKSTYPTPASVHSVPGTEENSWRGTESVPTFGDFRTLARMKCVNKPLCCSGMSERTQSQLQQKQPCSRPSAQSITRQAWKTAGTETVCCVNCLMSKSWRSSWPGDSTLLKGRCVHSRNVGLATDSRNTRLCCLRTWNID